MSSGEYKILNIVDKLSVNGKSNLLGNVEIGSNLSKNSLFIVNGSSKLYGHLELRGPLRIIDTNTIGFGDNVIEGTVVIGKSPLVSIPKNSFIIANKTQVQSVITFNNDAYSNKTFFAKDSFLNGNVELGNSLTDKITIKGSINTRNNEPVIIESPLNLKKGLIIEGSPISIGRNLNDNITIPGLVTGNVTFSDGSIVRMSKIQGPLVIEDLTYLNGSVKIGKTSSDTLNVVADTNVKGNMIIGSSSSDILKINSTVSGSITVSGSLKVTGDVSVSGAVTLETLKIKESIKGPLNVSGPFTVNNIPYMSTTQFICINKIPTTRIILTESGVSFKDNINRIVSGVKYKDIFRKGDKIKSGDVLYTILDNSETATMVGGTSSNKTAGCWLIVDKPVSFQINKYIELYHHYVLDTEYYNIAEFFLNSDMIPDINVIYLFLPYATGNQGRPVTFINRSYKGSNNNNINIVIRTRGGDKINRETDEINLFSRESDLESTTQIRFVSNGTDTWYII